MTSLIMSNQHRTTLSPTNLLQQIHHLSHEKAKNPDTRYIIVGNHAHWNPELDRKAKRHQLRPLIFSSTILKYNPNSADYDFYPPKEHQQIKALRKHCKLIGLSPKQLLHKKTNLCDLSNSNAGLSAFYDIIRTWIDDTFGPNTPQSQTALDHLDLYEQDQKNPSISPVEEQKTTVHTPSPVGGHPLLHSLPPIIPTASSSTNRIPVPKPPISKTLSI